VRSKQPAWMGSPACLLQRVQCPPANSRDHQVRWNAPGPERFQPTVGGGSWFVGRAISPAFSSQEASSTVPDLWRLRSFFNFVSIFW